MHSCLCEQYVKSFSLMVSGFDFLFCTCPRALWQQTLPEPVFRTANMSWWTCVVVKQMQSNPIQNRSLSLKSLPERMLTKCQAITWTDDDFWQLELNKLKWNLNQNLEFLFKKNVFENLPRKMSAILFRLQCVKYIKRRVLIDEYLEINSSLLFMNAGEFWMSKWNSYYQYWGLS